MTLAIIFLTLNILIGALSGCGDADDSDGTATGDSTKNEASAPTAEGTRPGGAFATYWYAGLAELNRYELKQARYGEMRSGDAVLIFVTEDFIADKQVKLDTEKGDRIAPSVMKVNITKKFQTGIYPYSMMTSVFTPVDLKTWPHTLKVTTSSQEWCGHTFTQLNRIDDGYRMRWFSYFEKESDVEKIVEPDLLEDEVWTRLRIDPMSLPVGRVNILPGTMSARLMHSNNDPVTADARRVDIAPDKEGRKMSRYELDYTNPVRTIKIDYATDFPHDIVGWTESYNDGGTVMETSAVRTDQLKLDYWKRNGVADSVYLRQLGLD